MGLLLEPAALSESPNFRAERETGEHKLEDSYLT